ncbi:YqcI/YcgG family protein [uncultured Metabacillus sp.]|uniref:YqcI/YcgG family protein n=1 Tax=uncultured Metabacillus sp. TaxID=2860135 RepID=UPI002625654A|nr:YqcI/YcgG family protein [uncultured Metabacillus sp.]
MRGLYVDNPLSRDQLKDWEKSYLEKFSAKMSNKANPFPCIPAVIGFKQNQLIYSFIGDPRKSSTVADLAVALSGYMKVAKDIGNYTSLIVFYETPDDMKKRFSTEEYEKLFWKNLSELNAYDRFEWPEDIPSNPHDPLWEFCYSKEKYFMYCATPAHKHRKSRHFDGMMLAITPRWVLEEFNKHSKFAKGIRKQIRKRLITYDSAPIHHDLNSYGLEDNFEWRQYFLRDDDTSLSKCPYHRVLKNLKFDT